MFFSGINVLKNETILSQGDTTWMRVIAQGVLLLAVLVLVVVMIGDGDGDGEQRTLHFTKNRWKQVCLPMSSEDQTPELWSGGFGLGDPDIFCCIKD